MMTFSLLLHIVIFYISQNASLAVFLLERDKTFIIYGAVITDCFTVSPTLFIYIIFFISPFTSSRV